MKNKRVKKVEQGKFALIDLEVIKKERLNKILIFITLAVVVIITSIIAGLIIKNSLSKKGDEVLSVEENTEPVEEKKESLKIPIYSEDAKERMKNIYVSQGEEKIAYLTFDDGPSQNITPQILDILRNEEVKATFFVLGSRVELYPELLKQEYEAGHYIANHGYSHNYTSIYSSASAVLEEYKSTEDKIKQVLGEEYSSYLFRFPGGSEGGKYKKVKNEAKKVLEQNNIAYINWNCLTNDSVRKTNL